MWHWFNFEYIRYYKSEKIVLFPKPVYCVTCRITKLYIVRDQRYLHLFHHVTVIFTCASKNTEPNVGHNCIFFKNATLASSLVIPGFFRCSAMMLFEKKVNCLNYLTVVRGLAVETGRYLNPLTVRHAVSERLRNNIIQKVSEENKYSVNGWDPI